MNLCGVRGHERARGPIAEKEFTDEAVPVGNAAASYRITAVRSGGTSAASEPATVFFGSLAQAA